MEKELFLECLQVLVTKNPLCGYMQIDKIGSDFLILKIPPFVNVENGLQYGATANVPFNVFKQKSA
jgi:hypothetical protein